MKNYSFYVWLHHKVGHQGTILDILDEMVKSQWLSHDLIREYQIEKLKEIILYAKKNTEYYKSLASQIGLNDVRDIKSIQDIQKIPPLKKNEVRNNVNALTTKRNDLVENQTGGSTGIPLRFFCNKKFIIQQKSAGNYRAYMTAGYKIGDKLGIIWGFDNGLPRINFATRFIKNNIYKYYELNSFQLSEKKISVFFRTLLKEKPRYLKGYANSLTEVAKYMLQNNIFLGYKVDAIFSEAERLDDFNRSQIEKAFGGPVYNLYGSREFGVIAVECPIHDGLHINFEQLFVEVMENGKILITSFLNLGTVFIRYEIGDYAEGVMDQTCFCGRSSQRLDKIVGRESDIFIASDGTLVHGEYITHLFYTTKSIQQFQIIQDNYRDFKISIVSNDPQNATIELEIIKSRLEEQFHSPLNIRVHFVNQIDKTITGKQKFTICYIKR
ncbi:MAG TPA: phenylacetate--CoA ligase family protein [Candidatus Wunengus sp. YC63]|uniref:phenylacetate--CoA ligase family protein n=1 Tax=unclassified Candidatus Wunengus TaxID=3367695 RepID=UPI00402961DA